MTIFAAGQFPIWHTGRVDGFSVLPYPEYKRPALGELQLALVVGRIRDPTYFTVYLLFWYSGWPDLATVRDPCQTKFRKWFLIAPLDGPEAPNTGSTPRITFTGTGRFEYAPGIVGITIVSFDFATSVVPWMAYHHLPALFRCRVRSSGFAMVQTLMIVVRKYRT